MIFTPKSPHLQAVRAHICTQANLLVRAHAHASARPLVTILTIIVTDERMPIASQRLVVFIMVPPDDAMRKDSDRVRNRFLLNATIQAAKSFHYDVKLVTNNGIDDPLYGGAGRKVKQQSHQRQSLRKTKGHSTESSRKGATQKSANKKGTSGSKLASDSKSASKPRKS